MIFIYLLRIIVQSSEIDPNTFSNYQDVQITHLHLEWLLDLENRYINSTVQYNFKVLKDNLDRIDLDIQQINIEYVYNPISGKIIKFEIINSGDQSIKQGDILRIQLEKNYYKGQQIDIRIRYSLNDQARALGFLYPNQTDSQTTPYLYSFCQDNKCRSMIPLQDTPSIKQTLSAAILVKDARLTVFMTGKSLSSNYELMNTYQGSLKQFNFRLDIPIPSYLIAVVAGNLAIRQVGQQTGVPSFVICEITCIDKVARELEDLQSYIEKLEAYIGPYEWGEYKIIILPPSAPLGGMEHPLLTFASPTIIVGDKSGVGTVIHEIGHSWTGNTVTCCNWQNLWINEGFCTFLERKILTQINGVNSVKLESYLGNNSMWQQMNSYGLESSYSSLHPNTSMQNPDDSMSQIPYDKGYQLLLYLEELIGEEQFKLFLRSYIANFKWKSIDEDDVFNYLLSWIAKNIIQNKAQIISQIKLVYKDWVYKPGLPSIILDFSTPEYLEAVQLAADWIKGAIPTNQDQFNQWSFNQKSVTLQQFEENAQNISPQIFSNIDLTYKLSDSPDLRIQYKWFIGCVKGQYLEQWTKIDKFLGTIGFRGQLIAIYRSLKSYNSELSISTYWKHRYFYHPSVRYAIDKDVFGVTNQ
ncbi:hypothetical protein pb186bvf_005880 [Paramecium bursaria]